MGREHFGSNQDIKIPQIDGWTQLSVDARPTIWGCTPLEGFILHIMTLMKVHNVFSRCLIRCNSLTSLEQEIFLYKKKQAKFS
jgi:hypothetical protein